MKDTWPQTLSKNINFEAILFFAPLFKIFIYYNREAPISGISLSLLQGATITPVFWGFITTTM